MSSTANNATVNLCMPSDAKQLIERAAACMGQTVRDYAISVLVDNARRIIEQHDRTGLTSGDIELFVRLLEDKSAAPNEALVAAAREYERRQC